MDKIILHIIILLLVAACSSKKQDHTGHSTKEEKNMEGMPGMETTSHTDASVNDLQASSKTILSKAELIRPAIKQMAYTINAPGYITFDERRNNKVAVRIGGRITKLYAKLEYQYVRKGDKLLELYSPELNTYEEEFLHHLRTKSDSFLLDATKQKLKLLGLSDQQVSEIERTGQPLSTITIYSPYDGFILYNGFQQDNTAGSSMPQQSSGMSMNGSPNGQPAANSQVQTVNRIREGDYVAKGQTLFMLNDCRKVYAILSLNSNEGELVKPNIPVKINSALLPSPINAKINFIEPAFKEGQKFIQVRVYLDNSSQQLKVNSIVNAEFESAGNYLAIPISSILSLGNRKFVWKKISSIKDGSKVLKPTQITTGKEAEGSVQVISGINEKDEIAKDAGFLLDSESLITTEEK